MTYEELLKIIEESNSECYICKEILGANHCVTGECKENRIEVARISYEAGKKETLSNANENGVIVVPDNVALSRSWHEGYKRGYEEAALNPQAWWIPDKNGEPMHFGDIVKNDRYEGFYEVTGIGEHSIGLWVNKSEFRWVLPEDCEKVTPDTKEKIIKELIDNIHHITEEETYYEEYVKGCEELAEKFYDRIAAQVTQEVEADVQKRVMGDA